MKTSTVVLAPGDFIKFYHYSKDLDQIRTTPQFKVTIDEITNDTSEECDTRQISATIVSDVTCGAIIHTEHHRYRPIIRKCVDLSVFDPDGSVSVFTTDYNTIVDNTCIRLIKTIENDEQLTVGTIIRMDNYGCVKIDKYEESTIVECLNVKGQSWFDTEGTIRE